LLEPFDSSSFNIFPFSPVVAFPPFQIVEKVSSLSLSDPFEKGKDEIPSFPFYLLTHYSFSFSL